MSARAKNKTASQVIRVKNGVSSAPRRDYLATEEPLELRLRAGHEERTLAITMRTPGADFELAAGFLFAEGVIASRDELKQISYCLDKTVTEEQRYNIVRIALKAQVLPELASLERHFFTTSACGVCGKASLDALTERGLKAAQSTLEVRAEVIQALPDTLREAQGLFETTGGLHAAALFTPDGDLLAIREDIGRHNAMDKLIGWALLEAISLEETLVMVSGRASYELLQKAVTARIPIFCAVSAPSSLAVSVAKRFNTTLIGFLREDGFNIYHAQERIQFAKEEVLNDQKVASK